MNIRCSVYIAASVDGYIARPDGDINWLHRPEYSNAQMKGLKYEDFISTVDTLVMGRHTFEKVLSFNPWPYKETPVVVLTGKNLTVPSHLQEEVRLESGDLGRIVSQLASEGKEHLYIDGGVTIQRFLEARLINEITITRIPVLLGAGIPLFSSSENEHRLRLIEAVSSGNGFVQERYEVINN